jgi:hypothetical protein
MPSSSAKWYHLTSAEKTGPTSSGYAKRRHRRYTSRVRSGSTQSRRSRGPSANFRTVSSSEARKRFRKISSGTKRRASALFGNNEYQAPHNELKRNNTV